MTTGAHGVQADRLTGLYADLTAERIQLEAGVPALDVFSEYARRTVVSAKSDPGTPELTGAEHGGTAVRLGGGQPRLMARTVAPDRLRAVIPDFPVPGPVDHDRMRGLVAAATGALPRDVRFAIYVEERERTIDVAVADGHVTWTQRRERLRIQTLHPGGSVQRTCHAVDRPLTEEEVLAVAREAAGQSAALERASTPDPAGRVVVLAPGVTGALIHEAIGHPLEADNIRGYQDRYLKELEQAIAEAELTVVDDPTDGAQWGAFRFDDEGNRAEPSTLVDRGRVTGVLTDLNSRDGVPAGYQPAARARRQSFKHPVLPRMSSLMVRPGTEPTDALLAGAGRAIYVESIESAQIDPRTGRLLLFPEVSRDLDGGRLGAYHLGGRIQLDYPALLSRLVLGTDVGWSDGHCRKSGQSAPSASGGPTALLEAVADDQ